MAAVTGAAILVRLPLAWLVVRTDLGAPPDRDRSAAAARDPELRRSACAARRRWPARATRAAAGATRRGPAPARSGFRRCVARADALDLPLRLSAHRRRARGRSTPRSRTRREVWTHTLGALPAGDHHRRFARHSVRRRSSSGSTRCLTSARCRSLQYDALTRSIYLQYRSLFDRTPAAVLGARARRVRRGAARARGALRRRSASVGERRRAAAEDDPARQVALARVRVLRESPLGFPRRAAGGARLLDGARVRAGPRIDVAAGSRRSRHSVSALAAVIAVVAVLPVALLAERYPSRWTRTLERLGYTGNALPGIVIALSLVFFTANYLTPLYQTLALLVFAYVVRFFPQRSRASSRRCRPCTRDRGGRAKPRPRTAARPRHGHGAADPLRLLAAPRSCS